LSLKVKIKESDRQLLILIAFFLIIAIDLVFVLGWQLRIVINGFKDANQKKSSIITLKDDSKKLEEYKKELFVVEKKLSILESSVTDDAGLSSLLESISNLAIDCGVKIVQIKPLSEIEDLLSAKIEGGKLTQVEIQLIAQCSFHQLGNFVSLLESKNRSFIITSLSIESDNKDYLVNNVRISLRSVLKTK